MGSTVDDRQASIAERLRPVLLEVFLASIMVNALLGIWALLSSSFGQTEGKVLATSLLISAAMLSVLVNGAPLRQRTLWPVPVVAALSAAGSFGLLIILMWAEIDEETPLKIVLSGLVIGAGATLAGLLALVPLRSDHQLVRFVNSALIALLVVTAIGGIWGEIDESWYARTVGVESVLVAAASLAIPVLWRFGGRGRDSTSPSTRLPPAGDLRPRDHDAEVGTTRTKTPDEGPTVGELTPGCVISVEPTASLRGVVESFIDGEVSFVVVEDSDGIPGVVSEHDVLRAIHDGADIDQICAADIMSRNVITINDGESTAEAARLMIDNGVRHLLVLGDEGGVLSIGDVLAAMTGTGRRFTTNG